MSSAEKNNTEIAISVKNVSKHFTPQRSQNSIKQLAISKFKKNKDHNSGGYDALKNVSFEVKKGEFFGIVGRNGSGKSTLLKMIAGVYSPTKGKIKVHGKLVPFIELGVGFNPELTAEDNVYLNGALLGFSRKEMAAMYQEIVDFAELNDHMNVKLKNFSSGMQVRLAFSIAIRAKADVLVIDEVLAVGDANFQRKCYDIFNDLKKQGRTIVFVTHSMGDVERFCDRVLVIKDSQMVGVFEPREAKTMYFQMNDDQPDGTDKASKLSKNRWGNGSIIVSDVQVLNTNKKPITTLSYGNNFGIKLAIKNNKLPANTPILVGLNIYSELGENLVGPNTKGMNVTANDKSLTVWFNEPNLNAGTYDVNVAIFDIDGINTLDHLERVSRFRVNNDTLSYGVVVMNTEWEIN